MSWTVNPATGKTGFKYTDAKRSKVAPWWEDGAKVSTSKLDETSATVDFTQAVDDELVHYYKVEVPDFKGDTKPKAVQGSFRTFSRFYVSPDQMSFELSGLKPSTTYHVKVTAYDSFSNASAKPLEGTFRTARMANFPSYPAATLPEGLARGQFMDMTFEGNLTDAKDAAARAAARTTAMGPTRTPARRPRPLRARARPRRARCPRRATTPLRSWAWSSSPARRSSRQA